MFLILTPKNIQHSEISFLNLNLMGMEKHSALKTGKLLI